MVNCVGRLVNSTAIGRFRSSLELYLNTLGPVSNTDNRSDAAVFELVLQPTCNEQMNRNGTVISKRRAKL